MSLINKFKEVFVLQQQQHKYRATDDRPIISTTTTPGILVLNAPARKLIGVEVGDRVLLIDMKQEAESTGNRYYITKGFSYNEKKFGMKISPSGSFMDAAFYYLFLMNKFELVESSKKDLLKNNLLIQRNRKNGGTAYKPLFKMLAEVNQYTEQTAEGNIVNSFAIAPDMPEQAIYSITNIQIIPIK